ncbi:alpha/beta hydrolase [Tautonia plasticadhaerens]|uniref:Acetylxylan esterase n=1 Tax=Tautonia plasticadhaerens TaxID=2527974 RepID=A0A518GYG5_9BACT|nr:alpha/beta hydrolase [Tautonia plasticadhaerens]QDV33636.1 Acetylxylan esterase precursor [Tautonia plasticadhaerens]
MPTRSLSLAWPILLLTVTMSARATCQAAEPVELRLWPGDAPGATGDEPTDVPTITVYQADPATSTGAAIVICPGGGYGALAMDHEGHQVARWLNSIGITGVILKYRLGSSGYRHPVMLTDAQRAIRTVRQEADAWGIDPARVGVLGFSAGGHLASTVGTHFDAGDPDAADPVDRQGSRPDLMILGYPVVALATEYAHGGSKRNLLGEDPPEELVESLSNERMVTPETPPTFLVHTNEDEGVPAENSLLFVLSLREAGVPVEFHLFEGGRHGLGLGNGLPDLGIGPDTAFSAWPGLCQAWLGKHGFLDRK